MMQRAIHRPFASSVTFAAGVSGLSFQIADCGVIQPLSEACDRTHLNRMSHVDYMVPRADQPLPQIIHVSPFYVRLSESVGI